MFKQVPACPPDPIFHLNALYKECSSLLKVNLGIGAYRDNQGKPWVLPAVQKAEQRIVASVQNGQLDHEYLPIEGNAVFCKASAHFILGKDCSVQYTAIQTLSGTGAVRVGAEFLKRFYTSSQTVYVSNPTWGNHKAIFNDAGLKVQEYRYWNGASNSLDFDGMVEDLQNAPDNSIVLLHACAHNPTGVDPSKEEWQQLAKLCKNKQHLVFFDSAYQGFASGDLDKDAYSVRLFTSEPYCLDVIIAQSYSKNFGLYNERCGCIIVTGAGDEVKSQLAKIARPMYSNPPAFGSRIVASVLTDPELYSEWLQNLKTMAQRIQKMRTALFEELTNLKTPGKWDHITTQIGMFSYTGLEKSQVLNMRANHYIFLSDNGRISMAGINDGNVKHVAKAIDAAVRQTIASKI